MDPRLRAAFLRWRDDLISLDKRNRLLYYRPYRSSTVEIVEPGAKEVSEVLLQAKWGWNFFVPPDPSIPPEKRPTRRSSELATDRSDARALKLSLQRIARRAEQAFMDTGIWLLYVGAGMLEWREPEEREPALSPVVLLPVRLYRASPRDPYQLIRAEGEPVLNPALTVKLETDWGISLPGLADIEEVHLESVLSAVAEAVKSHDDWAINQRIVLSNFSFHKMAMYRDLFDNEGAILEHPAVRALALGSDSRVSFAFPEIGEADVDREVPPEEMVSILDADSSQRQAIKAAIDGRSFVMDGPPGTGKSQTIANMISELIYRGKTVLFVSEKAAALDVVHCRLEETRLDAYLLALHSERATRKEVALELGRALGLHPAARGGLNESEIARARDRRLELSGYADAINEIRAPLGRTLQQAFGRLAQLQLLRRMPWWDGDPSGLDASAFERVMDSARSLARSWGPVARGDDFVWRDLVTTRFDLALKNAVESEVANVDQAMAILLKALSQTCDQLGVQFPANADGLARLLAVLEQLAARPQDVPPHWLSDPQPLVVLERIDLLKKAWAETIAVREQLSRDAGERYRDLDAHGSTELAGGVNALGSIPVVVRVGDSWTTSHTQSALDFAKTGAAVLRDHQSKIEELCRGFGIPLAGISVNRALATAKLASRLTARDLPEPQWLNPMTLPTVQEAAAVLGEVVTQYNRRRDELGEIFTASVLELDLEGMVLRFDQVHKGPFKFLRGSYRADRKAIAGTTRLRRADKRAVANLRNALEWQRLRSKLDQAERRHAGVLGDHYYVREQTDFESVATAIEIASLALSAAGRELDSDVMASKVARGSQPEARLHALGTELIPILDEWIKRAEETLGPNSGFSTSPIETAAGALEAAEGPLAVIQRLMEAVDRLTARATTFAETTLVLKRRWQLAQLERPLEASWAGDQELLGPRYRGSETAWHALREAVEWAATLSRSVGAVSHEIAVRLLTLTIGPEFVRPTLEGYEAALISILQRFTAQRQHALVAAINTDYPTARELFGLMARTTADIEEWVSFVAHKKALASAGLKKTVERCEEQSISAAAIPDVVERALLEGWADRIVSADDRLEVLRAVDLDQRVSEFRDLDQRLIKGSVAKIVAACNARRPRSATLGEAAVIAREAAKKRRHMPIRKLLSDSSQVTLALKPCFMMSPLSVSQFLTPGFRFDVVIFDEASQVKPADAINAIYRGSQLIVAGDNKQLPPSNFFEEATIDGDSDEYEEDEIPSFESVLDLSKGSGCFPSVPLRWHYRSQHEALIAYSNRSFYEGRLFTFPGAVPVAPDLGLQLIRVPGTYRRSASRDNPEEAAKVAQRVIYHADQYPDLTVGVVTFSEAQEDAVLDAVERARERRPDLDDYFRPDRLNGFFVKNLETVQGDERDIIIFSVGYGKDETGRFLLNLGPLTRAGGERRLNVAITRARRRVELVTSVSPADFHGQMTEGGGVWHLHRYLDYVERGGILAQLPDETHLDIDSPLEAEVARTIESWGYEAVPQVGTASFRVDIGVRHPDKGGRFILGVECDGAMYHSSRVARDRDRIRSEILQGLGWKLHRIWSPAWYRDRTNEEARLKAAIDEAAQSPAEVVERRDRAVTEPIEDAEYEEIELNASLAWITDYTLAQPRAPRIRMEMHLPEASTDLARMVLEVAKVEAPVHAEVALRRIREAWGVGRAGERIWARFQDVLRNLKSFKQVELRDQFVWLPGQTLTHVRIPTEQAESNRPVSEVSPQELDLAVRHVSVDAVGSTPEALTEAVARVFGWQRRGVDIQQALNDSVRRLMKVSELQERDGRLYWTGGDLPNHGDRRVARTVRVDRPPPRPEPPPRASRPSAAISVIDEADAEVSALAPEPAARRGRPVIPADILRCLTVQGYEQKKKQIAELKAEHGDLEKKISSGEWGDPTSERDRPVLQAALAALENKIKEIQRVMDESRVLDKPDSNEYAVLGSIVAIQEEGGPEEVYELVGPVEADAEASRINVTGPLGSALYGHKVGEEVVVHTPAGSSYRVTVRDISIA